MNIVTESELEALGALPIFLDGPDGFDPSGSPTVPAGYLSADLEQKYAACLDKGFALLDAGQLGLAAKAFQQAGRIAMMATQNYSTEALDNGPAGGGNTHG